MSRLSDEVMHFLGDGGGDLGYSESMYPNIGDLQKVLDNKIKPREYFGDGDVINPGAKIPLFKECSVNHCKLDFIDMPVAMEEERWFCEVHNSIWEVPMDVTRHWGDAVKVKKEGEE